MALIKVVIAAIVCFSPEVISHPLRVEREGPTEVLRAIMGVKWTPFVANAALLYTCVVHFSGGITDSNDENAKMAQMVNDNVAVEPFCEQIAPGALLEAGSPKEIANVAFISFCDATCSWNMFFGQGDDEDTAYPFDFIMGKIEAVNATAIAALCARAAETGQGVIPADKFYRTRGDSPIFSDYLVFVKETNKFQDKIKAKGTQDIFLENEWESREIKTQGKDRDGGMAIRAMFRAIGNLKDGINAFFLAETRDDISCPAYWGTNAVKDCQP